MSDYTRLKLKKPIETNKCYEIDRAPFSMVKGPTSLLQEKDSYELRGKPPLSSDKAKIRKLLKKRGLDICKAEIDNFAIEQQPLIGIIRRVCSGKIKVHVRVTVEEFPAFLVGGGPDHTWVAGDFIVQWEMDDADTYSLNLGGILPPTFGSFRDFVIVHQDNGVIHIEGYWVGPRSGVSFIAGGDVLCDSWVTAKPEAPVGSSLFYSSPYSDCTFTELCIGQDPHPTSDNFNNLDWKNFWDYRTFTPATSFPIGSWIVGVKIESYGPVED